MPGIIILAIILAVVLIYSFYSNKTFEKGEIYFEYPSEWSEDQQIGNFNSGSDNTTVYSQVILTANFRDNSIQDQRIYKLAYIIIEQQEMSQGTINLPSIDSIIMNSTNSSIGSVNVINTNATQLENYGPTVTKKMTIIEKNNCYYAVEYICPSFAVNETNEAYNMVLETLKIN